MLKITKYGPITRFDLARTLLGKGRYWTTAYLVDSVMIDTGCAHTSSELLRALSGCLVTRIVNSHTHEDHIGANAALQDRYPSLEILAHPAAMDILENPRQYQPLHPYRRIIWGYPKACRAKPISDGNYIDSERYRFQVIFTPGHSVDHLCLYEPDNQWLFTGDLFVGGKDRALRQGCEIWEVIASLKKIAPLPINSLFPGSARVRTEAKGELNAKIAYLEELGGKVVEFHQRGMSINEIVRLTCGGPMLIEAITLGHFSRRHLVQSFLN
jgi:glyoxylase-like metal-dependent hydrolase (beta-lactamase superfamily II)